MIYDNIRRGKFVNRPNRFIANIEIEGHLEVCHVKNTGRCREILVPGADVLVQEIASLTRKTRYDLISVYKGERLINIDSSAPNRVFAEWVQKSGPFGNVTFIKPEQFFGSSRFDFYMESDGRKSFVEIKGVTLEDNGVVRFPDAPTERGLKHVKELMSSTQEGYEGYIIFIVQMSNVLYFKPNWTTHRAFGEVLQEAAVQGVHVLALDCEITENSITAGKPVEVRI